MYGRFMPPPELAQISEIYDFLYLSGAHPVQTRRMRNLGITNIINATMEVSDLRSPGLTTMHIYIDDSPYAKISPYFDKCAKLLVKLTKRQEDWSAPWYELKLDSAYNYYRWSSQDSSKKALTAQKIDELVQLSGDPTLAVVAEATGDDVLQQRFLWLGRKVQ